MTEPTVRGATAIGAPDRRKKGLWALLGVLAALALLGLLAAFLLNKDDGKDEDASADRTTAAGRSSTTAAADGRPAASGDGSTTTLATGGDGGASPEAPAATTPAGGADDSGAASTSSTAPGGSGSASGGSGGGTGGSGGSGSGSAGASLRSGSTPLLPVPSTGLASFAGRTATGTSAVVQSVVSDEGFWVGPSEQDRVFVMLAVQGESPQQITAGQRLSFTGTVERLVRDPASFGVEPAEGAKQLSSQGAYVVADEVNIDG